MLTTESLAEIREAADLDTDADRETIRQTLEVLTFAEIVQVIRQDWARPYFGAVPYLDALGSMDTDDLDALYGVERIRDILPYLTGNLTTWRGPVARAVKAELKGRMAS